jgi:MYXO-CTERM domain-containing protein
VPPEVAPAWRLAPAAAIALTPEELALPEGTSLRPRPVLLQGTLPETYLLDDHQCGPADPDPSCVPEGEDETGGEECGAASTGGGGDSSGGTGEASDEGSSDGTGGVLTGLPPAEDEDDAAGCGCTSGSNGPWGPTIMLVALGLRRRRASWGPYVAPGSTGSRSKGMLDRLPERDHAQPVIGS